MPTDALLTRVVSVAAREVRQAPQGRCAPFWLGASVGGSLAASVLMAILVFAGFVGASASRSGSDLVAALDGSGDVNIAIDSAADIPEAEFRVIVTGTVALSGYEHQRELRWSGRLDQGVNLLRLPVVMRGQSGGHLLVEVSYGTQRKTFAVRLHDRAAPGLEQPIALHQERECCPGRSSTGAIRAS